MFLDDKIENNYNYYYQQYDNQHVIENESFNRNKRHTTNIYTNDYKFNLNTTNANIIKYKKIQKSWIKKYK